MTDLEVAEASLDAARLAVTAARDLAEAAEEILAEDLAAYNTALRRA